MTSSQDLVYFNYHEYVVPGQSFRKNNFTGPDKDDDLPLNLVVNHFPNPYVSQDDPVYHRTRIVRIPRAYDVMDGSEAIPQFSTYTPGNEPAALSGPETSGYGIHEGYVYGTTSKTQLVPQWVSDAEFREIVTHVNALIAEENRSLTWTSALVSFADVLTVTLLSTIGSQLLKKGSRMGQRLDAYTNNVNLGFEARHPDLKMILLSRTGFLLLDFQIPLTREIKKQPLDKTPLMSSR
ncbi:hypothetical protein PUMCH_002517 [Australozyma saopauloensis]|uniref:Ras modification protein ERF4 n=1 Tax=Australozyma saopauloensis TaxID=291208 RepID=A0AAX4H9I0_9ASCO|nr:hypothetical protein PUMCH_002517 [[Candida] saopauloensis]